jgi:hypothetical protein
VVAHELAHIANRDATEIARPDERIPVADLRQLAAVDALCVISRGSTRIAFFSDHRLSASASNDSPR